MTGSNDYSETYIVWTDELRKDVLPHRGMKAPTSDTSRIKPSSVFMTGLAALGRNLQRWADMDALATPPARELMTRVRARLKGDQPENFDATLEAGCILLSAGHDVYGDEREEVFERAVYFWAQEYGVVSTAKALVRCSEIDFDYYFSFPETPKGAIQWPKTAWEALRRLLAYASEDTYDEARAWLRAWSAEFAPDSVQRLRAAFVLSEDVDLRQAALKSGVADWGVVALPAHVDETKTLPNLYSKPEFYTHVPTLIWRVGVDILPRLLECIPSAKEKRRAREWVRVASVFVGRQPARAMVSLIAVKSVRPLVAKYLGRYPDLGRIVLPEFIAATKHKASLEAARALLESLPSAEAPSTAEAPFSTEATARVESLPPVLREPPWRAKRKADRTRFKLTPVHLPTEKFGEGERPPHGAETAANAFRADSKRVARQWLLGFPAHAAAALIPDAYGSASRRNRAGRQALRWMVRMGKGDIIKAIGERYGKEHGAEVAEAVCALVDLDPLFDAPLKPPKVPSWVDVKRLPRPRLRSGEPLREESTLHIVEMLTFAEPDEAYHGIEQVKDALDAASAADFARSLCTAWLAAGASPKSRWAMHGLTYFGDDESARWLVEKIGAWGEDKSKVIGLAGLEALAAIGSKVALIPVERWSRDGPSWLKRGSERVVKTIAERHGIDPDLLEDKSEPTLGLDKKGTLSLDYGARQFTVTFDEVLRPCIDDAKGDRLAKIPSVRKTDDQALAKQAKATWATLKKNARKLSGALLERMGRDMLSMQTWSVAEFEAYIVKHPLVGHLGRRLVFAYGGSDGRPLSTFRVSEDLTYATGDDEETTLPPQARIRIAHPVHMQPAAVARWTQIFTDYDIAQPFAQLSRVVSRVTGEDARRAELMRVVGTQAKTGEILSLDKRGWSLMGPYSPPSFDRAHKSLPSVIVVLRWDDAIKKRAPVVREHLIVELEVNGPLAPMGAIHFSELAADLESLKSP
ncbi:MAG: DUF4132 domain-containing protein [Polyangiales bacterium]